MFNETLLLKEIYDNRQNKSERIYLSDFTWVMHCMHKLNCMCTCACTCNHMHLREQYVWYKASH